MLPYDLPSTLLFLFWAMPNNHFLRADLWRSGDNFELEMTAYCLEEK